MLCIDRVIGLEGGNGGAVDAWSIGDDRGEVGSGGELSIGEHGAASGINWFAGGFCEGSWFGRF
jgi:hypothetical protein